MQSLCRVSAFFLVVLCSGSLFGQYIPLNFLTDGQANPVTGGVVENVAHPSISPAGIIAFDGDDEGTTLDDWIYVDGNFVILSGDTVTIGGVASTATVDNIDDFFEPGHVNDSLQVAWDGDLDGTSGTTDDEVLMLDLDVIMQEGTIYPAISAVEDPGEWNSIGVDAAGTVYCEVDMDGGTTDDEVLISIPFGGTPDILMMNTFSEFREGSLISGGALDGFTWDSGAFIDTNFNATGHMITDGNLDELNGVTTADDVVLVRMLAGSDYELLAREGDMITLPLGQTPLITSFQDPQIATNGDWVSEADTDAATDVDNIVIGDVAGSGFSVLVQEGQDLSGVTGIAGTILGSIDATAVNANGRVLIVAQVEDDGVNLPPYDEMLLQWEAGVLTLLLTDEIPIANIPGTLVDIEGDNIGFNDLDTIVFEGDEGTNDGIYEAFLPAVFPVENLACAQTPGLLSVDANWTIPAGQTYDGINVYVDGVLESSLAGGATAYTTLPAAMPNVSIQVEIEPFVGVDVAPALSCSTTVIAPRDFTQCSTPALTLLDQGTSTDTLDFLTSADIADVSIDLNITHPDVDDFDDITVTSPGGTSVTIMASSGPNAVNNIDVTIADFGTPAESEPYNVGAVMQPQGPGMMADFDCENSLGIWTLSINDQFTTDIGVLDEWCVNIYEEPNAASLCCPDPTDFVVANEGACGSGGIIVSWTNNSAYAGLELVRDDGMGTTTFPLAATDTSFVDAGVTDGTNYTYTIRYQCVMAGPVQDGEMASVVADSTFVTPVSNLNATSDFCGGNVTIDWSLNGLTYDVVTLNRAGVFLADVTGMTSFVDNAPILGASTYAIVATCSGQDAVTTIGVDHSLQGISDLVCTPEVTLCDGTVTLTWTNGEVYDTIDLFIDGVMPMAQPAGTDTTYTTAPLSAGVYVFDLEPSCVAGAAAISSCTVTVFVPPAGETDLILALEGRETTGAFDPGDVDSVSALSAALQANGASVYISAPPIGSDPDITTELPCSVDLTSFQRIWVMTGTFPDDYTLRLEEIDALGVLNRDNNIPVYLEGGDHWGFTVVNGILSDRDGVGNEITGTFDIVDGDDTFTQMLAQDSLAGLDPTGLFPNPVNYGQDQGGTDFTDHLEIAGSPTGGAADPDVMNAGGFFVNNDDGLPSATDPDEAIPYITAVYAVNTMGAPTISSSMEFGGFALDPLDPTASDADRVALAGLYLAAFGAGPVGQEMIRGDTNNDGGVNIADAIYLLGNLFPTGAPNVLVCLDAADSNDDGAINIADAIALLGSLFGMPATPLPSPNIIDGCGLDPGQELGCDMSVACP